MKHSVLLDTSFFKIHKILKHQANAKFDIINIRTPYNEKYGLLDF